MEKDRTVVIGNFPKDRDVSLSMCIGGGVQPHPLSASFLLSSVPDAWLPGRCVVVPVIAQSSQLSFSSRCELGANRCGIPAVLIKL